ncbi:AMP-dependent synthetase/ligase [Pseudonocardia acidicola]|uniref:Long-chain fatty acid--CoA ligase n=1 Tax=Pseudonocardia acidicola TaxID=2724939 RepID=A0ABX1SKS5_9PSEU|nr:long-chain fatty acid--CoA ligase [Pseudonocardia acidicola]NMI02174.1 long-chain fatty acid--CoA ligase [Pseudonocardia acidicola]
MTSTLMDRPASVARMFIDRVTTAGSREAFRLPGAGDSWESVSWQTTGDRVTDLAAGLLAVGLEAGERVAIVSGTRFEWILADLAVMCAGGATTTVYPSTIAEDVAYILSDSQSRVVIAEDAAQLAKVRERRAELAEVHTVVLIDGEPGPDDAGWVIGFDELARRGAELLAAKPDAVTERIATIAPDDLATLIYTSGTTGRSKGVRLTHAAWTYQGSTLSSEGILRPDDLQYLWLPLAHAFGKVLLTAQLAIGFATAVDGRVDRIVDNLAVVRPTFMGAAPRIFEKAYAKIVTTIAAEGGPKAKLFDWAISVGRKVSEAKLAGRSVSPLLAAQHRIADALVLRRIRDRFGGRIRFFVSGSAALAPDLARWFHAAGMLILEGYGMTECAAGASVNRPDAFRLGSVGRPLPGTEVTIAEDGEVLMRSPSVMTGYHQLPEATADALHDGWLATGDIGELDADGFLRITDRKKDLFKTSGGKYIAPQPIEGKLLALCPYVSQVVVHGAGRNFCSALIALDPDAVKVWAATQQLGDLPYSELLASAQVHELVQGYIDRLNAQLNRWETIKKFVLLERELTIEDGELTPSLKIRRKKVEAANLDRLDALYTS